MRTKRRGNFELYNNCTYYVPGVAELFVILVLFLAGSLVGSLASSLFILIFKDVAIEYAMLVAYPISFVPVIIYASIRSRDRSFNNLGFKLDNSNFDGRSAALCALMVIIGTFSVSFVADRITMYLPQMPESLKNTIDSITGGVFWADFLSAAIFAPIFEEWMCRGLVLRGLLNSRRRDGSTMKPIWAIIWSAFFFAVIHLNPWQAVPAFLLGCLFGYVYYKTGSLKLTMLMHFFNNGFAVVLNHIDGYEEAENMADVFPPTEYWIIFGCSIVVAVLVVLFFSKIKPVREQGSCDEVPAVFD